MALELTTDQARIIARLRRRWPGAELRVHRRSCDLIVEVRDGDRTISLTRLDGGGGIEDEQRLGWAA
jgi:hypothetical protein